MTNTQPNREEKNAEMTAAQQPPNSIGALIKKRAPLQRSEEPQPAQRPEPPRYVSGKFVVTCWDGDIYILEGYSSVAEIRERIGALDWVRMPNGSEIKQSSIAKIQSYEDYRFQKDATWRHKRGQYLYLPRNPERPATWDDPQHGEITKADVKSITGVIQNSPALPQSTEKPIALEGGSQ